ncbi:glycosyl transferase family 1 [Pseudalgibacter alginicilyticus]|uniref:Glycosyl transferase family 1 n=1 Tax=Pseudalgibacter alginicilyticus TaxID=1736674 RepID=A0A0P0D2J8_9FLAO|nr:glycosyltransferase family 1 protein [Pseudalgibacter alginicilyticus]ALJ04036.1 glycosyl transferase family 1 [Pseudalgibacter alginicilyticus]
MMNKPTRILQVLTIMNRGGAENMIMNYYRSIDKSKIQFDFLLHRKDEGAFDDEILSLGGKLFKMDPISVKSYSNYKKQLKSFFTDHPEYHIVHSHLDTLSFIVLKAAKEAGVNIRIGHNHLAIEPFGLKKIFKKQTDLKEVLKDLFKFSIRSKVGKYATHYFACGEKAGVWLYGEENKDRIKIINNAINTKTFIYNETKAVKIKKDLGISNKKVIGHVGRFNEQKNHIFLIKIFYEMWLQNKNLVLVLIGDGNLKPKIEEQVKKLNIKDNVKFLGLRNDVPDLLQAIDIILFPSLYEGLPVSLVEAQAAGLKVITSTTVDKETAITKLVTFCDLKESETYWANLVLKHLEYERKNMFKAILDAQYDIEENTNKLQQFYIETAM